MITGYLPSCDCLLVIHLNTHYLRLSTYCFLSQTAVFLVSAIPSNIFEKIRETSKSVRKSSASLYGDLRKSWEIYLKKITEVSAKILIWVGVLNFYRYGMNSALIFTQVESDNVYCQLPNSADDVLSFFLQDSQPRKTQKSTRRRTTG